MRTSDSWSVESTTYRFVTASIGELFIALALIVFAESDRSTFSVFAVLVIAGLGVEAIVSACFGRKSILAKMWSFH